MIKSIGAAALASVLVFGMSPSANAQPFNGRHAGGHHQGNWRPHHHGRGGNGGAVVAAGVMGLVLGAALSNANRYDPPPAPMPYRDVDTYVEPYGGHDWARYCSQKFADYEPASGTYMADDGRRYPCH